MVRIPMPSYLRYSEVENKNIKRVKGHKRMSLEWNGERGWESCWTWQCQCGASEEGSTRRIAMDEWLFHLQAVKQTQQKEQQQ